MIHRSFSRSHGFPTRITSVATLQRFCRNSTIFWPATCTVSSHNPYELFSDITGGLYTPRYEYCWVGLFVWQLRYLWSTMGVSLTLFEWEWFNKDWDHFIYRVTLLRWKASAREYWGEVLLNIRNLRKSQSQRRDQKDHHGFWKDHAWKKGQRWENIVRLYVQQCKYRPNPRRLFDKDLDRFTRLVAIRNCSGRTCKAEHKPDHNNHSPLREVELLEQSFN